MQKVIIKYYEIENIIPKETKINFIHSIDRWK